MLCWWKTGWHCLICNCSGTQMKLLFLKKQTNKKKAIEKQHNQFWQAVATMDWNEQEASEPEKQRWCWLLPWADNSERWEVWALHGSVPVRASWPLWCVHCRQWTLHWIKMALGVGGIVWNTDTNVWTDFRGDKWRWTVWSSSLLFPTYGLASFVWFRVVHNQLWAG